LIESKFKQKNPRQLKSLDGSELHAKFKLT